MTIFAQLRHLLAAMVLLSSVSTSGAQPDEAFKSKLTSILETSGIPGGAVALADGQGLVFQQMFGVAQTGAGDAISEGTRFAAAGLGEAFVALALAIAVEEGRLTWDTPLQEVLPFAMANAVRGGKAVTVRHLATHTAGLRDQKSDQMRSYLFKTPPPYNNPALSRGRRRDLRNAQYNNKYSLGHLLRQIVTTDGQYYGRNTVRRDEPGQVYAHSDLGAALGAYLVESIYSIGFDQFVEERIWEPLKMAHTSWQVHDAESGYASAHLDSSLVPLPLYDTILYPAYGLYTTAGDLGKFLSEMIRGLKGQGQLVSADGYQALFAAQFESGALPGGFPSAQTNAALFWDMTGAAFTQGGTSLASTAYIAIDPQSGSGRVFLANVDVHSRAQFKRAFDEAWALLAEASAK